MRRLRVSILAAAGAAVLAWGILSRAATETAGPVPSLDQIVSARKAGMAMSLVVFSELKARAEKRAPSSEQAFMARGLANWAAAVPGMFPAGTGPDKFETHAKPEIWTQWPKFELAAADYVAAAQKLPALATAGDNAGVARQLDAVRAACNNCHDAFRNSPHTGEKQKP